MNLSAIVLKYCKKIYFFKLVSGIFFNHVRKAKMSKKSVAQWLSTGTDRFRFTHCWDYKNVDIGSTVPFEKKDFEIIIQLYSLLLDNAM